MVNFDSRDPGTSAGEWRGDARFAGLPQLDIGAPDRVIVVAAHPDDETLGAGGLMAECSARGIPVEVVVVTDGAAGHVASAFPGTDSSEADAATAAIALAARRAAEAVHAIGVLSASSVVSFLEYPDGGIRENRSAITSDLVSLVGQPDGPLLIVAPWRGDGHRDHRVLGEICAEVSVASGAALIEYPIWMWHWSAPDNEATPWDTMARLPISAQAAAAKRRAVDAYQSQITQQADASGSGSVAPLLHARFLAHFDADGLGGSVGDSMVGNSMAGDGTAAEVFIAATPARVHAPPAPTLPTEQLPETYFDAAYSRRDDPWGFETRWYESRKRALTVAALPAERYGRTLEIGCSIGVLTAQLAPRCDSLLAVDISQAAVDQAAARVSAFDHVAVVRADVAADFPAGTFDLVVLSEVGYYFDPVTLESVLDDIERALGAAGTLVVCHWRHEVNDYPLTGDAVHLAVAKRPWERIARHVEDDFVLEVFSPDGRSVAERTGLR